MKIPKVKYALMKYLERYDGPFTVLMSGGLDSHAVLFSLLELGVDRQDINVMSVTIEGHESRDFRSARNTAEVYGINFQPIILPTDMPTLKKEILQTVKHMGARKKVEIESFFAFRRCIRQCETKYIASGLAADIYFALTKTGSMHFRDNMDGYRIPKFAGVIGEGSQTYKLKQYCKKKGKVWLSPWVSKGMLKEFEGTTWDAVNRPKQKQPVRDQFSEYLQRVKYYNRSDMHGGDSGIKQMFEQLLDCPEWNAHNGKSVVGIYNRAARGELKL